MIEVTVVVNEWGEVITAEGPLTWDQVTTAVPPGNKPLACPTRERVAFAQIV